MKFPSILAGILIPVATHAAPSPVMYMYDIGDLAGKEVFPTAINLAGEITGYAFDGVSYVAFISRSGVKGIEVIKGLSGTSQGNAINDAGQVAGSATTPMGPRPFITARRDSVATFIQLPLDTVLSSGAYGINNFGVAVGYYSYVADDFNRPMKSFIVEAGSAVARELEVFGGDTLANTINDAGQIAGISVVTDGEPPHIFIRDPLTGDSVDYGNPTGGLLFVRSLSPSGRLAGEIYDAGLTSSNPFMLSELTQSIVIRPTLGGKIGGAYAVSNGGRIAGSSVAGSNVSRPRAFIAGAHGRLYDLNQFIANKPKNVSLIKVTAANSRGQLAAWGDNTRGYIVCPTPRCI